MPVVTAAGNAVSSAMILSFLPLFKQRELLYYY
jgi:hypothetical protein